MSRPDPRRASPTFEVGLDRADAVRERRAEADGKLAHGVSAHRPKAAKRGEQAGGELAPNPAGDAARTRPASAPGARAPERADASPRGGKACEATRVGEEAAARRPADAPAGQTVEIVGLPLAEGGREAEAAVGAAAVADLEAKQAADAEALATGPAMPDVLPNSLPEIPVAMPESRASTPEQGAATMPPASVAPAIGETATSHEGVAPVGADGNGATSAEAAASSEAVVPVAPASPSPAFIDAATSHDVPSRGSSGAVRSVGAGPATHQAPSGVTADFKGKFLAKVGGPAEGAPTNDGVASAAPQSAAAPLSEMSSGQPASGTAASVPGLQATPADKGMSPAALESMLAALPREAGERPAFEALVTGAGHSVDVTGLVPGGAAASAPAGASTTYGPAQAQGAASAAAPVSLAALPVEIGMRALEGVRQFEIRLAPEDLGRVDVTLNLGEEGSVDAHIVVERPETLLLLQRDARSLERAFEQAGLQTGSDGLRFSLRSDSQGGGGRERDGSGQQQGQGRGPLAGPLASEGLRPMKIAPARGLDITV